MIQFQKPTAIYRNRNLLCTGSKGKERGTLGTLQATGIELRANVVLHAQRGNPYLFKVLVKEFSNAIAKIQAPMLHWEMKTISNHYKRSTKDLGSIDIATSMEYAICRALIKRRN